MNDTTPAKVDGPESYEAQFAAWQARKGITNAKGEDLTAEDIMRAEDAKSHGKDYCWRCGDEFLMREMVVDIDPYIQDEDCPQRDDGYIPKKHRIRVCEKCHEEAEAEYADEAP